MKYYRLYIKVKDEPKILYGEYKNSIKAIKEAKLLIKEGDVPETTVEEIEINTIYREYIPQKEGE